MQEIVGGRKFSADCAWALAAMGFAVGSLWLSCGPIAAAVTEVAAEAVAGFVLSFLGSGLAGKDVIVNCL